MSHVSAFHRPETCSCFQKCTLASALQGYADSTTGQRAQLEQFGVLQRGTKTAGGQQVVEADGGRRGGNKPRPSLTLSFPTATLDPLRLQPGRARQLQLGSSAVNAGSVALPVKSMNKSLRGTEPAVYIFSKASAGPFSTNILLRKNGYPPQTIDQLWS